MSLDHGRRGSLLPALVYTALSASIVASLGALLVPTIAEEFDVPVSSAQWMLTVYLLVGAVTGPVMGRLGDGRRKKLVLVTSLTIVLVGSVIAALATDFTLFLFGRGLQGLTFGIVPVTISLVRKYVPAEKVTFGIASLSVTGATGAGIGFPLTGMIAELLNFRWAFWFAAIFVVSALVVAFMFVPRSRDGDAVRGSFDFVGSMLLGLGLASLLVAVSEGPNWGWLSPMTLVLLGMALVLLSVWVVAQLRSAHPLVNLRVLRHGDVLLANATGLGLGAALYIGTSIISVASQAPVSTGYGVGLPVFWAGFLMVPQALGSFAANQLIRRLSDRVALSTFLTLGAAAITAAAAFLVFFHFELWQLLVGMLFFGLGLGVTWAAMPSLIARSVAATELGSAVSFNQVLRTIGGSVGSAIASSVLAAYTVTGLFPSDEGITATLIVATAACAAVLVSLVLRQWLLGRHG